MAPTIFTYEEASAQIDAVRQTTRAADERLQQLRTLAEGLPQGAPELERLQEQMNEALAAWAESINALGALPKGVWTVDFDSGQGFYYCWTLDESILTHYHAYEDGFRGRKPLVDGLPPDFPDAKPPILN
jgi:hypothetical protein